jgi:ATP-binding cassette, subfamily B, bacterial MsbA
MSEKAEISAARYVLRLSTRHRWTIPLLVALGLLGSLAEGFGLSLGVLFVCTLVGVVEPLKGGLLGDLVARAVATTGDHPTAFAVAVAVLMLVSSSLRFAYTVLSLRLRMRLIEETRNRISATLLTIPFVRIREISEGELLSILTEESAVVGEAVESLTEIIIELCTIAVFAVLLLVISWQITVLAVMVVGCMAALIGTLRALSKRLGQHVSRGNKDVSARMLAMLHGMRTIRAFGYEAEAQRRFEEITRSIRRYAMRRGFVSRLVRPVNEIGYLVLLTAMSLAAIRLQISPAIVLACAVLLYRMQPQLRDLQMNRLQLAGLLGSLDAVYSFLAIDRERPLPGKSGESFAGVRDSIKFEGVSFSHPGAERVSLRRATFRIPRGITMILGPSGAGKTTIVNLLLRLYEPQSGRITVDGRPLGDIRRESWLGSIALAGQDVDLVEPTVVENIAMGDPSASPERVNSVAQAAGAAEFVYRTTEGLQGSVGDRGLKLSGGQRQRIGLARALLRNPQILILDEATSAVDWDMDRTIRSEVIAAYRDRVVIMISHRLDIVNEADHVICVEDGEIVEEGRPQDLMSRPNAALPRLLQKALATT